MATSSALSSVRVESSEPVEVPTSPASPSGLGTFRALRHRNYRLFFVGQMISLVGTWLHNSVLIWLAGELTKESRWPSLWPSLVGAAQLLPVCLLGVWGGALVDRWPRRTLLVFTQVALAVLAVALGGLTFAGSVTVWHLLVIATLTGVVNASDMPARLAFLAEMVGREDLVNAVGLNSLLFNIARVAGPLAGSFLLPQWGPAWCFVLNGI